MGTVQGNIFVGWNGGSGKVYNSSSEILEDILTVKDGGLVKADGDGFGYSEDHRRYLRPKMELRTLFYPYGRCIVLSPPATLKEDLVKLNSLTINFDVDAIKKLNQTSVTLWIRIYLMDKANSAGLCPQDFDMLGDPIKVKVGDVQVGQGRYSYFKTKISRSRHVLGDPKFECSEYTEDDSYYDCITSELEDLFVRELGCVPPLLVKEEKNVCNKRFNNNNISDEKLDNLKGIFNKIYFHDIQLKKCKTPCTKTVYHSKRYLQNVPSKGLKVVIMFETSITVTESSFMIDGPTLLTRFGGSVSSGRTLLWILLSILALTQVGYYHIVSKIQKQT